MPQAYLALRDDEGNYLITQKRLTNNWWQGSDLKTGRPQEEKEGTIVNQAGQYSLPGGKMDWEKDRKNPVTSAMREFREETGIDIAQDTGVTHVHTRSFDYYGNPRVSGGSAAFHVVVCQTSKAKLEDFQTKCNENTAPAIGRSGPASNEVKDWEIGSAHIVPTSELHKYLGERNELDDNALKKLKPCETPNGPRCSSDAKLKEHGTQKIDWYGSAAKSLIEQPQPSRLVNSPYVGNNSFNENRRGTNRRYNPYSQRGNKPQNRYSRPGGNERDSRGKGGFGI